MSHIVMAKSDHVDGIKFNFEELEKIMMIFF
jgi:hypothetical protein